MNEKLQYASMLEIPVSTCNVTFKPAKKRRFGRKKKVDPEAVKEQLLNKINAEEQAVAEENSVEEVDTNVDGLTDGVKEETVSEQIEDSVSTEYTAEVRPLKKQRGKFKISVIGVQLAIIGVLLATIFLTNALYTDSGINVFLRGVFGTDKSVSVDDRIYADFSPVINLDDGSSVVLENGVMTFSGSGSVYSPCDGKVSAISKDENGKFTLEITHNSNFKSVLTGVDYAYAGLNDTVYHNIPVGYVTAGATMCFTGSDGSVISDYQIVDDTVVWAV